eukprot:3046763-Pleurochrysis_carterae.AAC.1
MSGVWRSMGSVSANCFLSWLEGLETKGSTQLKGLSALLKRACVSWPLPIPLPFVARSLACAL